MLRSPKMHGDLSRARSGGFVCEALAERLVFSQARIISNWKLTLPILTDLADGSHFVNLRVFLGSEKGGRRKN